MFSFLLLKTQSLSAAGGEEEKEEIRQMEGGSEDRQTGKCWRRREPEQRKKYRKTLSLLNGFTYRFRAGIKNAILLFVVVFM